MGLGLKILQWAIRLVQLLCAALVLGVYAYFLATLYNHNLAIATSVRAVVGISGAAVLYTGVGLLLLCCLAGVLITSAVAILLDVCFIGAFIYVAYANRNGAGSCNGYLDTPFGSGQSSATVVTSGGFTALPSYHTACRLQTASLAVSIIAIFFFCCSIIVELLLIRQHRRDKHFGPSPANNYTSGYAANPEQGRGGFMGRFRSAPKTHAVPQDPNTLPQHTQPGQLVDPMRQSYATEATAVGHDHLPSTNDFAKQEAVYRQPSTAFSGNTQPAAVSPMQQPAQMTNGWHDAPQTANEMAADNQYQGGTYNRF
ncbi:hypothetical protein DCS_05704 [Drechmeria coniospora]|uniref:MARVEL domain-containing protein n=1 Tax=Drechmeria coniospora TaxID=98403 RepID=A0A151GNJ0_DRECN|nr:hypothetical protein DCS_05704 [Drechmeria coniospora]KYK58687.1 hypothetical protein DCS_05704 [Drechmeria coniospora]